jgi:hypothetical protein
MMRFMSASSSASSSTASLSWRKNTHGKMVTSTSSKSSSDARKREKGNGGNKKSLRVFSRAVPADVRAFMDTLPDEKVTTFPRGAEAGWKVHKFGGTCVGSSERISGVCDLLIDSAKNGNQTFAVVSAMGVITKSEPKVTDCLINATTMAAARSRDYVEELEKLREKHTTTATDLLTIPKEFDKYMESFNKELEDLGSMLKAISIVGCSTETFADFVVGHGELWTARLTRRFDVKEENRIGSTPEKYW